MAGKLDEVSAAIGTLRGQVAAMNEQLVTIRHLIPNWRINRAFVYVLGSCLGGIFVWLGILTVIISNVR
ncbi:unnamed protein product [marine sediment metagenome]|uniref:Uncharacterized protein n=1 Tax=marine sediment metagenome TaxID=412755 RepID=X1JSU4_9ZZZZ